MVQRSCAQPNAIHKTATSDHMHCASNGRGKGALAHLTLAYRSNFLARSSSESRHGSPRGPFPRMVSFVSVVYSRPAVPEVDCTTPDGIDPPMYADILLSHLSSHELGEVARAAGLAWGGHVSW